MKHYLTKMVFIFAIGTFGLSCSSSSDDGGDPAAVAPTNLQVSFVRVGENSENPGGDGSGMVTFTATADNATSYKYIFPGNITQNSSDGNSAYTFTQIGLTAYSVTVQAFGANNTMISRNIPVSVYYEPTLVWADEFEVDGAPDTQKWQYDLGAGGWGNNEPQTYTTNTENVIIEDGKLKITVKKDPLTNAYTSTRMNTGGGKFQFTYGKIDVRAKLPIGGGTWPAIWMLGSNYTTAPWPACGEIDIMEHVGNNQNHVLSTLHYPGNFGGNGISGSTTIPTASTEFHIYSLEWTPQSLRFYVDGVPHHTFSNNPSVPFNHDFFIILNVAIGGNFGGAIDPAFTQSTMEVDYVRVYQ